MHTGPYIRRVDHERIITYRKVSIMVYNPNDAKDDPSNWEHGVPKRVDFNAQGYCTYRDGNGQYSNY